MFWQYEYVCVCVCVFAWVHPEWQQSPFYFLRVSQVIWGHVASSSRSPLGLFFPPSSSVPLPASLSNSLSVSRSHTHTIFSQDYLKSWGPGLHVSVKFLVQLVSKHMSCPCFDCRWDQSVCQELCSSCTGQRSKKCLLNLYLKEESRWSTHTGAELVASQNSTGWSFKSFKWKMISAFF